MCECECECVCVCVCVCLCVCVRVCVCVCVCLWITLGCRVSTVTSPTVCCLFLQKTDMQLTVALLSLLYLTYSLSSFPIKKHFTCYCLQCMCGHLLSTVSVDSERQ